MPRFNILQLPRLLRQRRPVAVRLDDEVVQVPASRKRWEWVEHRVMERRPDEITLLDPDGNAIAIIEAGDTVMVESEDDEPTAREVEECPPDGPSPWASHFGQEARALIELQSRMITDTISSQREQTRWLMGFVEQVLKLQADALRTAHKRTATLETLIIEDRERWQTVPDAEGSNDDETGLITNLQSVMPLIMPMLARGKNG